MTRTPYEFLGIDVGQEPVPDEGQTLGWRNCLVFRKQNNGVRADFGP